MPPDFEKLPVPGMSKEESLNKSSETKEIKSPLNLKTENENIGDTENSAGDIESSILKKIVRKCTIFFITKFSYFKYSV